MIWDVRLGRKHVIQPKVVFEMIKLIAGSRLSILHFENKNLDFKWPILLPRQILDFKYSLDMKLSLEEDQNKIFKDYFVQKVRSMENKRISTSF